MTMNTMHRLLNWLTYAYVSDTVTEAARRSA